MSSPNAFRWAIAVPSALGVGVAIAFGSWHFRDTDFRQYFQRESDSAQAGAAVEGGGHSGAGPVQVSSPASLPSLTQGAVTSSEPQPTREQLATLIEQEKRNAANEALTSYILTNEELPRLNQTTSGRPPDHPLVEELINKPNAMRSLPGGAWIPGTYGSGSLGGYPQDVLREAAQAFNSPEFTPLRADARAVTDMTLGQVSALMDLSEEVQGRLERGSDGSLGNILNQGSSLNLSSGTRRAVGNIVANALGGSGSGDGYGSGGGTPFIGNYMTPPVGSPTVPVAAVDSSELAAAAALVTEYRRLLPSLSDAELKEYLRRVETEGKIAAMQWVVWTKTVAK